MTRACAGVRGAIAARMKKKPQTIAEHFAAFDAAMTKLVRARCCECDLTGIEPALTVARHAMERALPHFPRHERGDELTRLERAQIDLAYYALVIVATIVEKEIGMQLESPDALEKGRIALRTMFAAFTPYLACEDLAFHCDVFGPQCDDEIAGLHAN